MRNAPSSPSLSGPLWPGMVVPDRVLCMGQIALNCVLIWNWIVRNRTGFGINNLQWLRCHKTKLNQIDTRYFLGIKLDEDYMYQLDHLLRGKPNEYPVMTPSYIWRLGRLSLFLIITILQSVYNIGKYFFLWIIILNFNKYYLHSLF